VCSDDIFSLAVTIVELLFEQRPFSDEERKPNNFHDAQFDLEAF
jgi:hypothetical protein